MVNLQAQLAYLKEQAAQNIVNVSAAAENPNEKYLGNKAPDFSQDLQSWFQSENPNMEPQFLPNLSSNSSTTQYYGNTNFMDPNPIGNYESSVTLEESVSFSSFDENSNSMSYNMQTNSRQWGFHEADDLQSVAFGYGR